MKTQVVASKAGSFKAFQDYTLAVARRERAIDPQEPKVWIETCDSADCVAIDMHVVVRQAKGPKSS